MKKNKILVNTNNGSYPILIGIGLINNLKKILNSYSINSSKYLIIFDKNIPKKYIKTIKKNIQNKTIFVKFSSSEKNKNQKSVNSILNILLKNNFNRNDCIISIGGGIAGDVSGFAASIFKRGIKFINIPTTLLAQVDSSLGGKVGINTASGKNLIESLKSTVNIAEKSMNDTKNLISKRGRSSKLGERSIGHIDPGAASSFIIIKSIYKSIDNKE